MLLLIEHHNVLFNARLCLVKLTRVTDATLHVDRHEAALRATSLQKSFFLGWRLKRLGGNFFVCVVQSTF